MLRTYKINSQNELINVVTFVKTLLQPGMIVSLNGTLGSGKTTFVKKLITSENKDLLVTSPTFAIINEYKTHFANFIHIDAYRLNKFEDFLDEYFNDHNIVLIEWFEKLNLPSNIVNLEIEFIVLDQDKRIINIRSKDENVTSNTSI